MAGVIPAKLVKPDEPEENLLAVFSPPETGSAAGTMANEDALAFAAERDIEKDGKEKEHDRHQTFRDHINRATIMLFWVVVASVFVGIVTFVYHMVTPDSWHYLTQPQVDKLQTMLGAAVLSSALTNYVKKKMD